MKFTSVLATTATVLAFFNPVESAATLEQKWNISDEPTFTYGSLSFELEYTVSDFMSNYNSPEGTPKQAQFELYDERCKQPGNDQITEGGTSGIDSIVVTDTDLAAAPGTGENMNRQAIVNITLDPETISRNPALYSEDTTGNQVTAEIRFCIRFGLHTKSATSVEVNFLETLVTLNVDLTDGFQIGSIAVEPRDKLVRTANQAYNVEGYRCDAENKRLSSTEPINQGTVVKVCVTPDTDAQADGIKMRSIDEFTWTRPSPTEINQPAIIGRNLPALNQLTTLVCTPGSLVCSFETILFAGFYTTPGAVLGSGVASMQFGSTNTSRRLRSGAGSDRDLQEDDAAAAAEFELDFAVNQAAPQGTSGASSSLYNAGAMAVVAISSVAALL